MSGQPAPLSQRAGVRPAVRHPIFARLYALVGPLMDRGGLADRRRELLAGLDRISRFRFPEGGVTMPTSPHVLGAASRQAP